MATTIIYECEICGACHPWNWNDDCRDDANRYAGPEDYAQRNGLSEDEIEVRTMDERVEHDDLGCFGTGSKCPECAR